LGKLSDLIFGTKEQRKRKAALKQKEREAYRKGYEETKVKLARKKGRKVAKTPSRGRIESALVGAGRAAKNYMRMFDLEPVPKRRKKKKRKK